MKQIVIVLANGFEEVEALVPTDVLRRAGFNVVLVGLDNKEVVSAHNVKIICDDILSDKYLNFDCIILPGGMPGTINLKNSELLNNVIKSFNLSNKLICAICAAPSIFESLGLLKGKRATSYPGFLNELDTIKCEDNVVVDNNIITSRGAGTAFDFAFAIAGSLGSNVEKLKKVMIYEEK